MINQTIIRSKKKVREKKKRVKRNANVTPSQFNWISAYKKK